MGLKAPTFNSIPSFTYKATLYGSQSISKIILRTYVAKYMLSQQAYVSTTIQLLNYLACMYYIVAAMTTFTRQAAILNYNLVQLL